MSAKLSSSLPDGGANGLSAIAEQLADNPEKIHVVVALIDCSKITTNVDNGDVIPTARIRRIEAMTDPEDNYRLKQLVRRQYERRTGKTVLPFELEQDLNDALGGNPPS